MSASVPMSLQRGFALFLALALALGAMVPLVAASPTRAADGPTELFFSEYVEGSSFNKALEIFNGTGAPVNLAGYSVALFSNGSATVSQSVNLSGTLADGDVFVLAHGSADAAILAQADLISSAVVNFNGDDAISLRKDGVHVDVFGQIGFDPGTAWGSGSSSTVDNTLRRKPTVIAGRTDGSQAFDPSIEWDGFGINAFDGLGSHVISTGPVETDPTGTGSADPATVPAGGDTTLSVRVTPGTNPTSTGLAVTADLTPIGGDPQQAFSEVSANTFSHLATVDPATEPGDKIITATITDEQDRSAVVEISMSVAATSAGGLVISEFRVRGPNGAADEFVEIHNASAQPVDVSGWLLRGSNNAAAVSTRATIAGGTVIGPGCFYLFTNSSTSGGPYSGSVPGDQTFATGITDDGGIAIARPDSTVVDQVGMSAGSAFKEGTPLAPLSGTANNVDQSYERKPGGAAGHGTDTDDNAADFALIAPSNPQSSASTCIGDGTPPADDAPTVTSTTPLHGSVKVQNDAVIGVTFSEAVDVAPGWYEIVCSISGAHTATHFGGPASFEITPDAHFTSGDRCTVTIVAEHVTDQDTNDPPDTMAEDHAFSFSVGDVCGNPTHFIHEIQGPGMATPIPNAIVTVEAVVVGDYQGGTGTLGGFFLQSPDGEADDDPLTSEGLFIFDGSFGVPVSVGDVVSATGRVIEFNSLTELTSVTDVTVCDTGASVTPAEITLPVENLADWERWEGMLASFTQTMTVTEHFGLGRFGEVVLSSHGRQYQGTHLEAPGVAAAAHADLNARTRIILDDANTNQNADPTRYPTGGLSAENTLRTGSTTEDLTAVVHEGFGSYRLQPVGEIEFEGAADRPETPPDVGGRIQVAAFNVLNYFNGNGMGGGFPTSRGAESQFEFDRQHAKIVSAIAAMDAEVVGLMEIENDGADSVPAIATLVEGLNETLGDGTYDYIETGVIGTDEIAVALIYQPAAVEPLGDFAILDSSVDPAFNDQRNRPVLAQTFTETATGAGFTVAVNHLKSKGSGCGAGDDQPDALGGNCNGTRTAAAAALASWLNDDPTGSAEADAVIIGDLNSYAKEDPISELTDAGYTDLLAEFVGPDAYTYVFMGASGNLDYAMTNESMTVQVTGTDAWHINTDEPPVLDYNVNFKTPNHVETLYAPDAFRSSDHDPVIIGLDLHAAPVITSLELTGPARPGETVELTATYTDPNAGEEHTATVDWGDGTVEPVAASDGSVTATHSYAAVGFYAVTLIVTDPTELSGTETYRDVVIYDPAAGFVTGGGGIDTHAGIASFEISLKYQRDGEVPRGDVTFELPDLAFEATSYEWLVVDGSRAWLSGEGTVDGAAGYAFLLAVTDEPDRLRAKIWSVETGEVLFDNQPGEEVGATASEPIRNGQIKVHQAKGPGATGSSHPV